jgi:hypothetical protein
MGGLLPPFGDALLGQYLAQPGMLVGHGSSPFLRSALLVVAGWLRMVLGACRLNPAPAIRERSPVPHLWTLAPYGRRFALAGHAG